jgi:hypothetical protein
LESYARSAAIQVGGDKRQAPFLEMTGKPEFAEEKAWVWNSET